VRAIAETNSRGNPYAVLDATLRGDSAEQPLSPRSLEAAVAATDKVLTLYGQPLIGLMQVPIMWARRYQKMPEELFDPCTNLAVGTAKLSELQYECLHPVKAHRKNGHPDVAKTVVSTTVRRCVLHRYAQAIRMPELELVVSLELEHQRQTPLTLGEGPKALLYEPKFDAMGSTGADVFFAVGSTVETPGPNRRGSGDLGQRTKEGP
jgi:hypothetical protein